MNLHPVKSISSFTNIKIIVVALIANTSTILLSPAQSEPSLIDLGTNHYIYSEVLAGKKQIQVYLPTDYHATEEEYPVLYLLDGQQYFSYGVSLSKTFRQFELAPKFIVVGINTDYPGRYSLFGNEKDKFIAFLEEDLLPYVAENFRTKNERLLFGWQYAGSLGLNIMLGNDVQFDSYILASPFPIWDRIDALDSISEVNSTLLFTVSPDEYQVNQGTNKLDSLLSSKTTTGLNWTYLELLNEEHRSTGYPTLYHGLRNYYRYYPEFQVDNLQKFLAAGGLDYAFTHARERGRLYGFSSDLTTWSKYTIIRSTIRANDYAYFQTFCDEFFNTEFIVDMKIRALEIADFYEGNGNFEKAIEIYKIMLPTTSNPDEIFRRIGKAFTSIGNTKEAEKYLQRVQESRN